MPVVEIEARNAANTSGTTAVAGAFRPKWQRQRNAIGTASFLTESPGSLSRGDVLRGRCGDLRFPFKVERFEPTMVSRAAESVEACRVSGRHLVSEWADSTIHPPPTLSNLAETVPVLDERVMGWMGPDFDHAAAGFVPANFIAVQGWPSTFYRGLPAGWWDGAAQWVGPHSGDDDNAPAGVNLFVHWVLVGTGPCFLEYGGDNFVTAYVNGRRVGDGRDFKRKQTHEFEVTRAGWMLLAFEVVNAPDDGPPGGNPTALIYTLTAEIGNPTAVYARSSSTDTHILEYPSVIPEVPVGRQIRQVMIGNGLLDDWTVTGTETHDENGVAFPLTGVVAYRFGRQSPWDVLSALCGAHIDIVVDDAGRTLRPLVKGTAGTSSSLVLTTGYSTAGVANPDLVNVLDLSWDLPQPEFDALTVRWARGRFTRGSGDRWGSLDIPHITDLAAAERYTDDLLAAGDIMSAAFTLDPHNAAQWPGTAFDVFDTLNVPGPGSHNSTTAQTVVSVTVEGDDDGDPTFDVEVGSLVEDRVTLLERASRQALGSGGGLAASASTVTAQFASSTGAGDTEWSMFGTGDWSIGTGVTGSVNPPRVGTVSSLRVTAQNAAASGSTTFDVQRNGVTVATLSMGSGATSDVESVEVLTVVSDDWTLDRTSDGGHTNVTVTATLTDLGR